jgi:C-terminal processing protease CtpA/Prc
MIAILAMPARARADDARDKRWHEDLDVLAKGMAEKAKPLQDDAAKKEAFLDAVAELDKNVSRKTDEEIYVGIMKVLALTGDSHTSVSFGESGPHRYPIQIYWFAEGVYVTKAAEGYEQLLGARLVSVGNLPIDRALAQLAKMVPHENDSVFKAFAPHFLTFGEILRGMDIVPDSTQARFVFRGGNGKKIAITLGPVPEKAKWISFAMKGLRYAHADRNYWFQYLPESNSLYFQYQRCIEMKSAPFAQFEQQLLNSLDANPVKRLIIDLRDNLGGNSEILDPFIEALVKRNSSAHPLPLYALIGRFTFSSGALNAVDLKLKAHAVFVGEPSGAKPNHYGEVNMLELPNSHLKVFYSTMYWRPWPSDSDSTLNPDITIRESWKDFAASEDPTLNALLAGPKRFEPASR